MVDNLKIMLYYIKSLDRKEYWKIKQTKTTKDWLPFEKVFEKGIIKNKNNYIKIIKVIPINYDLKSNLEKGAILEAYKLFLKTCDFDIQIIVQSKKEDLSRNISNIKEILSNEKNQKIKKISEEYIEFIKEKNEENKSSSKNFYIVLKNEISSTQIEVEQQNVYKIGVDNLSDMFFKVKESLSRCGNLVQEVNSKEEVLQILNSFYNPRIAEKEVITNRRL